MRSNPNETLSVSTATYVPGGSQVTVTIGRNVGDSPMSQDGWTYFRETVASALRDLFRPSATFGPFGGHGEWDGIVEESSVVIVISHYPASVEAVTRRLAQVAAAFDQDAIAWSFGPNLLATR